MPNNNNKYRTTYYKHIFRDFHVTIVHTKYRVKIHS
jgi:hypothetical protein